MLGAVLMASRSGAMALCALVHLRLTIVLALASELACNAAPSSLSCMRGLVFLGIGLKFPSRVCTCLVLRGRAGRARVLPPRAFRSRGAHIQTCVQGVPQA